MTAFVVGTGEEGGDGVGLEEGGNYGGTLEEKGNGGDGVCDLFRGEGGEEG